ncbi:hypothetical protein SELMODRAFT_417283 [Selaginella moellendorffii]|nr:hypothetical protein SELMODRAFT_417283 [Selaginella moellendorffii]
MSSLMLTHDGVLKVIWNWNDYCNEWGVNCEDVFQAYTLAPKCGKHLVGSVEGPKFRTRSELGMENAGSLMHKHYPRLLTSQALQALIKGLLGKSYNTVEGSYEEDSPLSSYIPSNQQRQRRNREELPGSHEALQAAQEYQQHLAKKSRSTIKVLNQCCVSGTYVMTLPSNYCKKMMPHGRAEVIVRDRSGHQWRMRWNWTMQPVIGAGWKAFCVHHELVKGDVLVFQKENSSSEMITFRVEIFKRQ